MKSISYKIYANVYFGILFLFKTMFTIKQIQAELYSVQNHKTIDIIKVLWYKCSQKT